MFHLAEPSEGVAEVVGESFEGYAEGDAAGAELGCDGAWHSGWAFLSYNW